MSANPALRRGRLPSIATAAKKTQALKRSLKTLLRDIDLLEERLAMLDRFYRDREKLHASRKAQKTPGKGLRGRGDNVRDVAFEILSKRKKPMNIGRLAEAVIKVKGGRPGDNFTQNLGAALYRDRRFKRAGRGLYGVR
jgi:hypothetical protein